MRFALPSAMSLEAGYVDTAGFLALSGLFTAHVTGNFVTIGSALVLGTSGITTKLAALPLFCLVVLAVRVVSDRLAPDSDGQLRALLWIKLLLLTLGAALALAFGPFTRADSASGFATGMTLVAGMAVQNALQRLYLGKSPPTTIMTGNTTQVMLDLGSVIAGVSGAQRSESLARMRAMTVNVVSFATGCACAAALYHGLGMWCFLALPGFAMFELWRARALKGALLS